MATNGDDATQKAVTVSLEDLRSGMHVPYYQSGIKKKKNNNDLMQAMSPFQLLRRHSVPHLLVSFSCVIYRMNMRTFGTRFYRTRHT
jgi:hypothetical protein